MITTEITKLFFTTNDIYILESYNNTIIINNNNQGLLLLNDSLQIQKELIVPQKAPVYHLYKKYNDNNVMLYLPDINQIIFIDIETSNYFTIKLPEVFNKEILSPNYYWNDNILILVTYDKNFYQYNFSSKVLHPISSSEVKKICSSFSDFFDISTQYNVVKFYPEKKAFIFQNDNNTLGFFNCQQNTQNLITQLNKGWHDVEYNNDIFIFIHENKIELISTNDKILLIPHANFVFLRAKFIDNNCFVILCSNPANPQENFLEIYKIIC